MGLAFLQGGRDKAMEVQKISVHYISKTEGEQKARVDLSNNLLDLDYRAESLINNLNESYRKSQITYAVFDKADENVFPRLFDRHISCASPDSFLDFSREAAKNLKNRIENISPAKGGFLVFSQYKNENKNYLSVYLIRDTIGILFKKDDPTASFKINPAEHLDLDKLAMACRINIDQYRSNEGKYLSFLKRKMNDISVYFTNWIAAKDQESNKTITQDFYQLINLVACPVDEKGTGTSRELFKKNIFDYVKTLPAKIVNLNDISQHFYNDSSYLIEFAENKNFNIDTEFQPDEKVMKQFVSIDLVSDGISIRFSRGLINNKVRFDEQNKNVVIIESEKFANDLREMVDRHEPD
jgi:nucleoid-associated protein